MNYIFVFLLGLVNGVVLTWLSNDAASWLGRRRKVEDALRERLDLIDRSQIGARLEIYSLQDLIRDDQRKFAEHLKINEANNKMLGDRIHEVAKKIDAEGRSSHILHLDRCTAGLKEVDTSHAFELRRLEELLFRVRADLDARAPLKNPKK